MASTYLLCTTSNYLITPSSHSQKKGHGEPVPDLSHPIALRCGYVPQDISGGGCARWASEHTER